MKSYMIIMIALLLCFVALTCKMCCVIQEAQPKKTYSIDNGDLIIGLMDTNTSYYGIRVED